MKVKSELQKSFNREAKKYGIKAYTSKEFDTNASLRKAVISFEKWNEASSLDVSSEFLSSLGIKSLDIDWMVYLQNNYVGNTPLEYEISYDINKIEYVKSLFQITDNSLAKQIASIEYIEIMECNFNPDDKEHPLTKINDAIDQWSKLRKLFASNLKLFLRQRFPRWDHATVSEKEQYIVEIKKLKEDLLILNIENELLNHVVEYFERNKNLNSVNKYLASILVALDLPNINYQIALDILKFTKKF